ncbi:hypothetical protein EPJ74_02165 [Brachyspira aalborgi]|uniref:Uncharacterized protein n=1 Tax=Brachyspira aalborgi TaxID=29522 RepID=A0A5C8GGI2_9SPIR|nr:hypothetical protein [Brachyspira aalborgi]TXJ61065.1 hypothetical protein EPJ74_02165 [Brachyspira aalborgi]
MKRKVLSFIAVFVSLSAIVFVQDNEIKIPTDLYKISDYGRNLDIYHTERGSSTLTSVWGYIIQTNIYYRNNIKTCYLVFDLYSEENASDKFYSVIFSDKKENNKVVLNINLADNGEKLFKESDATIHLRNLQNVARRQHRLSDSEIDSLIKLIEDNKFQVYVRFNSGNNNYYSLSRKDFSKKQVKALYTLLKFYKEIKNK